MNPVVRVMGMLGLALAILGAPAAFAADSGDIILVSQKGEVQITMNGVARNLRDGGVLEPPATLRTGRDGAVELRQGATTVGVGPGTLLEFPALEKRGAPIDRIVQPRGNAFYNIGKRDGRKLRVETPYLVGVIKGTQFNVAAQDGATTISLFEGLLEVRATDDSDLVELKAGEIASRKRGDKSITVMKMDGAKAPASPPRAPADSGSNNTTPNGVPRAAPRTPPADDGGGSLLVDRGVGLIPKNSDVIERVSDTSVTLGANAAVGGAGVLDVNVNAGLNVGGGSVDVGTGARIDAGPVSIDAAAAANLGGDSIDLTTSTSVSAGPVAVETGADVNLSGSAVDITASTSVDAASLTTEVGAAAAVDLSGGTVDSNVVVGASAPLVAVDVGATAAVDAVAGTVNLGLDVAGIDLDAGLDLGLGDSIDSTPATDTAGTDTTAPGNVVDVGGLLDGLLRRPGRK